ncbi:GSCOCG00003505001-RA-CDS [Cotesia congregata]|nr:GSCOCG00003505001-RA-CDS [Cotesia congregata]
MSEIEHLSVSPVPSQPGGTLVIQPSSYRILRSPSHESVTTDLSLFSVSSIASNAKSSNRLTTFKSYSDAHLSGRGSSPNPDARDSQGNRPADIPEILWFEEETELIRSCAALSSALGLQKSFSASDVSQLPSPEASCPQALRSAVSALALDSAHRDGFLLEQARLDHASRSCSTWVAVGDIASTSQLPSPHGGVSQQISSSLHPQPIPFTAADLVKSVNKKVRQNYIRRRLLTTYRALERLSQSEFNLDRLEAAASAAQTSGVTLIVPGTIPSITGSTIVNRKTNNDHPLTVNDVERERGKQLTKYERNMMIFNWLHNLDDDPDDSLPTESGVKVLKNE